jgi:diphthamide biosynthesis enzyme Dph1/Dph2-like protein
MFSFFFFVNQDVHGNRLLLLFFHFEQCEIFIYVSCAQTALLDSKDFLAPVITPFEALLAFTKYLSQSFFNLNC